MAMGKRGRQRQENLFIASNTLVKSPGHPFYGKLNQVLGANGFDEFVEGLCQRYYVPHMGRKGIPPGVYFRMLLIGYFEGLDSERGVEWRVSEAASSLETPANSLSISDAKPLGTASMICRAM